LGLQSAKVPKRRIRRRRRREAFTNSPKKYLRACNNLIEHGKRAYIRELT
jgi:hypothetical protein